MIYSQKSYLKLMHGAAFTGFSVVRKELVDEYTVRERRCY